MLQRFSFIWLTFVENHNLQCLLNTVFSISFIFRKTGGFVLWRHAQHVPLYTIQKTWSCVTVGLHIHVVFPLLCLWPVIDNYLAEVSWPHVPILSLWHKRNWVHTHRALLARQWSLGGWRRRRGGGGGPRGHRSGGKGNGCPEEGVQLHFYNIYVYWFCLILVC